MIRRVHQPFHFFKWMNMITHTTRPVTRDSLTCAARYSRAARHHRVLIACAAAFAPALSAAQGNATPPPDQVIATFTIPSKGALLPPTCATKPVVSSFSETTPRAGAGNAGSFEIEVETACVTPFFQAAAAKTKISAQFTFTAGPSLTPVVSYVLTDAQIYQADLGVWQSGARVLPSVQLKIMSPMVKVVSPAAAPATTAGTAAGGGTVLQQSNAAAPRAMAPAFKPSKELMLTPAAATGESWARDGVHGTMTVSATTPSMNVTFATSSARIRVPGQMTWNTYGAERMVMPLLDPGPFSSASQIDKAIDSATPSLRNAWTSRARVTATYSLVGVNGVAGITASVDGMLCKFTETGSAETILLSGVVTIRDTGSGQVAVFTTTGTPLSPGKTGC